MQRMVKFRSKDFYTCIKRYFHILKNRIDSPIVPECTLEVKSKTNKVKMCGWQIHNYGGLDELQFTDKMKIPQIRKANDCLIKVLYSTVNPIDVAMIGGYGSETLNILRCQTNAIEFPLTLGREFCGILMQKGMKVSNSHLSVGERVWGVVPFPATKGSHAEYVVVPDYCVSAAPQNLSAEESSAVLYAGLTAWSGIYITAAMGGILGALNADSYASPNIANSRILILGGSGSVGSTAIQMLKAGNACVVATCSEDAIKLVQNIGADYVVDYRNITQMLTLKQYAPYDLILDCSGQGPAGIRLLDCTYYQYVTYSSPLLKNIDNSGLGLGVVQNAINLLETNAKSIANRNGVVKWGFFMPNPQGIKALKQLAQRKKLLPIIEKVYKFDELPKAFQRVQDGHLRGKIVIEIENV